MALPGPISDSRHDWETIKTLLPYQMCIRDSTSSGAGAVIVLPVGEYHLTRPATGLSLIHI